MDQKSMCTIIGLLIFTITVRCYSLGSEMLSAFGCTWPYNERMQLRCDYENCPYMTIQGILASRLQGNMTDCPALNSSPLTRNPIPSCNYQLMDDHEFLREVTMNCTRRQTCAIQQFNQLFRDSVGCGRNSNNMRNWIHIRYECSGGGLEGCIPITTTQKANIPTTTTTTQATIPTTVTSEAFTGLSSTMNVSTTTPTDRTSISIIHTNPSGSNFTNIILPVLGSLVLVVFMFAVGIVLYRYGACTKNQQRGGFRKKARNQSIKIGNGKSNLSFKIDAEKLRDLEDRLNYSDSSKPYSYADHYKEVVKSLPNRKKVQVSPTKPRVTGSRSQRPVSLGAISLSDHSPEKYYSDSSISTTTNEDELTGKKRRRAKALPPLPKPKIRHSEVYFTETETENESARSNIKPYRPVIASGRELRADYEHPAAVHTNSILKNNSTPAHRSQSLHISAERRERNQINKSSNQHKKQSKPATLSHNPEKGAQTRRLSAKICNEYSSDSESQDS